MSLIDHNKPSASTSFMETNPHVGSGPLSDTHFIGQQMANNPNGPHPFPTHQHQTSSGSNMNTLSHQPVMISPSTGRPMLQIMPNPNFQTQPQTQTAPGFYLAHARLNSETLKVQNGRNVLNVNHITTVNHANQKQTPTITVAKSRNARTRPMSSQPIENLKSKKAKHPTKGRRNLQNGKLHSICQSLPTTIDPTNAKSSMIYSSINAKDQGQQKLGNAFKETGIYRIDESNNQGYTKVRPMSSVTTTQGGGNNQQTMFSTASHYGDTPGGPYSRNYDPTLMTGVGSGGTPSVPYSQGQFYQNWTIQQSTQPQKSPQHHPIIPQNNQQFQPTKIEQVFNLDSFKEATIKDIKLVNKAFKLRFKCNEPPNPTLEWTSCGKSLNNIRLNQRNNLFNQSRNKNKNASFGTNASTKSKMPQSMQREQDRTQKFTEQLKTTITKWDNDAELEEKQLAGDKPVEKQDIAEQLIEQQNQLGKQKYTVNIYKERDDDYPIISNRITQLQAKFPKNAFTNAQKNDANFMQVQLDPIRVRLRILPVSAGCQPKGMNSDFFFREAAKKSLRGDLTYAVDLLKRGLLMTPEHYQCRFNQGVLMFKFGLIKEALEDFKKLTESHPHQSWPHFNLAICLMQLGVPKNMSARVSGSGQQGKIRPLRQPTLRMNQKSTVVSTNPQSSPSGGGGHHPSSLKHDTPEWLSSAPRRYTEAFDELQIVIDKLKHGYHPVSQHQTPDADNQLEVDAYRLQAMCKYRLHQPIEAVMCLNAAKKKLKSMAQVDELVTRQEQGLLQEYTDLFLQDMHVQVTQEEEKLLFQRRRSFDFDRHQKLIVNSDTTDNENRYSKKQASVASSEMRKYSALNRNSFPGIGGLGRDQIIKSARFKQSQTIQDTKKDKQQNERPSSAPGVKVIPEEDQPQKEQDSKPVKGILRKDSQANSARRGPTSPADQNGQTINNQNNLLGSNLHSKPQTPGNQSAHKRRHHNQNSAVRVSEMDSVSSTSFNIKAQAQNAKNDQDSEDSQMRDKAANNLGQSFRILLSKKFKDVIKEQEKERVEVQGLTKKEYFIFSKFYKKLIKEQDLIVNEIEDQHGNKMQSNLRFRQMYLQENSVEQNVFPGCNPHEIQALIKRAKLENWIMNDDFIRIEVEELAKDENFLNQTLSRFMQLILSYGIKNVQVPGTGHQEATMFENINTQKELIEFMDKLEVQQQQSSKNVDTELHTQEATLKRLDIRPEDLRRLNGGKEVQQAANIDEYKMNKKDQLIERLQEALDSDNMTVDDVLNILTNELQEKETQRQMRSVQNVSNRLLTERLMAIIKIEFQLAGGKRDIKILDDICSNLRYFYRLGQSQRKQIYQNSKLVFVGAQEEIYKQGDPGDHMYIILKGKITQSKRNQMHADIQQQVASLTDGDCFGEASLVDDAKPDEIKLFSAVSAQYSIQKRQMTTRTSEDTYLLKIENMVVKDILQPSNTSKKPTAAPVSPDDQQSSHKPQKTSAEKKKTTKDVKEMNDTELKEHNVKSDPCSARETSPVQSVVNPEPSFNDSFQYQLNQKIQFLMSYDMFCNCPAKVLMPIALNMQQKTYTYGDFLMREGQTPQGLFLIKSGVCRVAKNRTLIRNHKPENVPGAKKPVLDKHSLFNRFDHENTLLNCPKSDIKSYQHSRVFVDSEGGQLREKIQYEDMQTFTMMMPGSCFGGRVLPPYELYMNLRKVYFGKESVVRPKHSMYCEDDATDEKYHMLSFLNVVADSGVVEAFLLTKSEMQYLHDQHLKYIYERIIQTKESDRPVPEDVISDLFAQYQAWEDWKVKTVEDMHRLQRIEKKGATQTD